MTEGRLAAASTPTPAPTGSGGWSGVVDRCAREAGPFPEPILQAWREEVGAVEDLVRSLERAVPGGAYRAACLDDGVHALVTVASARFGTAWSPMQLRDVASAVELAYRAVRHHGEVVDSREGARATCAGNRRHVLDGDWSITQAARLTAEVGPAAYRLLVRGYGLVQLARLEGRDDAGVLLPTARALGALVSGVNAVDASSAAGDCAASRVWSWVCPLTSSAR